MIYLWSPASIRVALHNNFVGSVYIKIPSWYCFLSYYYYYWKEIPMRFIVPGPSLIRRWNVFKISTMHEKAKKDHLLYDSFFTLYHMALGVSVDLASFSKIWDIPESKKGAKNSSIFVLFEEFKLKMFQGVLKVEHKTQIYFSDLVFKWKKLAFKTHNFEKNNDLSNWPISSSS